MNRVILCRLWFWRHGVVTSPSPFTKLCSALLCWRHCCCSCTFLPRATTTTRRAAQTPAPGRPITTATPTGRTTTRTTTVRLRPWTYRCATILPCKAFYWNQEAYTLALWACLMLQCDVPLAMHRVVYVCATSSYTVYVDTRESSILTGT